ncbi:MAG: alpha/beta hydrolase family protein [Acidimicrobiales bacterium]
MGDRPSPADLARIEREVTEALDLYERQGWLAEPITYHEEPPAPERVRTARRRSGSIRYTSLTWLDRYAPHPDEPGAERFGAWEQNRIARAALLEHRTRDRPWLVCLHGFGMGTPALDLRAFRALHLHRDLDLNVALLTLPFHGRRNPGSVTRPLMPSIDVMDTVHGLSQAVWDARQLMAHLRARTSQPLAVMGLSLGGLVAGVVASVDEPDAVVLLVPAVDLPGLMGDATALAGPEAADAAALFELARPLYGPVSPLQLTPQVPVEHRYVIAGTLDRFARPSTQAVEIWRHWDEPALHWYHGGHVSVFWAGGVQRAVDAALDASGLLASD